MKAAAGLPQSRESYQGILSQGLLSIQQFVVAATVGEGADEFGGLGQFGFVVEHAGSVQVDVGEEERHRATLGDLLGFRQSGNGSMCVPHIRLRYPLSPSRQQNAVYPLFPRL